MNKDEALKLALAALRLYQRTLAPADTQCKGVAAVAAIEQALAAPAQPAPVQPVAWAEYNFKKGKFTGLTTNDINAVDSVGDGCQWVPQLQATPPAAPVQEPVEFEDWHSANYVQPLEKYGDSYKNMHVRNRWQGWLGAKSTAPPAAPEKGN
jgi:hypothetical protein